MTGIVGEIINDLQALEAAGIEYCLLRNWEFLDGGPIRGDIDVLIPRSKQHEATDVFEQLGYHPSFGRSTRHSSYRKIFPEEQQLISIDVAWNGTGYNGLPLVDHKRLLENRTRHEGIWIPCDEDLFVQLLFHAVLNKNGFDNRERYREKLLSLRNEVDRERVFDHARFLFGSAGETAVQRALEGNPDAVTDLKWKLVFANCRQRPTKTGLLLWNLFVLWQLLHPLSKLNRRRNPFSKQPTVVLLGPDGSGKTTTGNGVREVLESFGRSVALEPLGVYNGTTVLMRTLKRVRNRLVGYDREAVTTAKESGEMELSDRNGPLKTVIHGTDILLRILKTQASGADVIVADRYLHDLFIHDDPRIARPFVRLFARGDVYVYVLDTDADVISDRSEYGHRSVVEMQRRLDAVDGPRIDVSESPEKTIRSLISHLCTEASFPSNI